MDAGASSGKREAGSGKREAGSRHCDTQKAKLVCTDTVFTCSELHNLTLSGAGPRKSLNSASEGQIVLNTLIMNKSISQVVHYG